MRRRLLTAASALSLVLCVAMAVLWVRDGWHEEMWMFQVHHPACTLIIISGDGSAGFEFQYPDTSLFHERRGVLHHWTVTDSYPAPNLMPFAIHVTADWEKAGFLYAHSRAMDENNRFRSRLVLAPCWFWIALIAVCPTIFFFGKWRRRTTPGRCKACGYDLRATPNRCPECGAGPDGRGFNRSKQR